MYQKVSTDLNFVDREKEVEKFWRENDIFRKRKTERRGLPTPFMTDLLLQTESLISGMC